MAPKFSHQAKLLAVTANNPERHSAGTARNPFPALTLRAI